MAQQLISSKQITIQVVERSLLPPAPGTATPRHAYTPILTVRAKIKTSGVSEFASVEINGKRVSHTFSIRWTSIPFDTRHRVRYVDGTLYQILRVDNVDEDNSEIKIHCAQMGNEEVTAAR